MSQEVEVKLKVDTSGAEAGVDKLGKSFNRLDKSVKDTKSDLAEQSKEALRSSGIQNTLSQMTGGVSDAFISATKGINLSNLSLKAMKGAIMSTGIGVFVILIGELVTALAEFYSSEKQSEQAVNDLTDALERQSEAFDEVTESNKFNYEVGQKLAKANGATKEQLKKANDEYLKSEKERTAEELKDLERKHMAILQNSKLTDEDRQKALDKANADIKAKENLQQKFTRDKINSDVEFYAEEKEAQKQASDKAQAKRESDAEKQKQFLNQQKQALKNIEKKYADEIENLNDKTEQQKLDRQKERALEELDLVKLSEKEKAKAKEEILKSFQLKQEQLEKANADKLLALTKKLEEDKNSLLAKTDEEKLILTQENAKKQLELDLSNITLTETEKENARRMLQETFDIQNAELKAKKKELEEEERVNKIALDLENETISFDEKRALIQERENLLLNDTKLTESQRLKIKEEAKDATKKIDEEEYNTKKILLESVSQSMEIASGVIGKETAVGKGLALASALMNTYQGITAGVKLGYPQAIPAVAMASLTGFGAVKNILKTKVPGGGSGGGGSTPTGMQTPTPSMPNFNVIGNSGVNQIAQTLGAQQPVQAYVVANNVTTAQSMDRNIIQNASLG